MMVNRVKLGLMRVKESVAKSQHENFKRGGEKSKRRERVASCSGNAN